MSLHVELILGGARSGKSHYAELRAQSLGLPVVYVATARAEDDEMQARIAHHRAHRPVDWTTIETPLDLAQTIQQHSRVDNCVLVDCLTLWLTNQLLENSEHWHEAREQLLNALNQAAGAILLVSNEVGEGVVPLGELSRQFVDESGWLHQQIASVAHRVVRLQAGLPLALKGNLPELANNSLQSRSPISALMVQGTTSDAGKSVLVAGLGRALARRQVKVAPFKPQNMALNSAVTCDGGEIGRSQALQAQACMVLPTTDMNPVLLKPNTDIGAQVIVDGQAYGNMDADTYHNFKPQLLERVCHAFKRLSNSHQVILVEGAGSPAEINLRDRDIANMGFAEAVDIPVIIVADIDRGGVFAHLYGTYQLLSTSEQRRIIGFVINRFRGDVSLLEPGLRWLEAQTGKPVLGVLPYLMELSLDAEDSLTATQMQHGDFKVVVPVLPRISNHTDFDSLRAHPDVDFRYVRAGEPWPEADLVILPGSKNVRHDLAFLREQGWEQALQRHVRYGGKLLGICGGYQMLGQIIRDPLGIEGVSGESAGLGYLAVETTLAGQKQLSQCRGRLMLPQQSAAAVQGYEIHVGVSQVMDGLQPMLQKASGIEDGAISSDGQVAGCYLHGLFDEAEACQALLRWAGLETQSSVSLNTRREQSLERLADAIDKHLDMRMLWPAFYH